MTPHGQLTADPDQIEVAGRKLDEAHNELRSMLAPTWQLMEGPAAPGRGRASSAAWSALLEDWRTQDSRHAERADRLVSGLRHAAAAYRAADEGNAQDLQADEPVRPAPTAPKAAPATAEPKPTDSVRTPYGDLGKWMIDQDGNVQQWEGKQYQGKPMYEPINAIFVDKVSKTPEEAVRRLNQDFAEAGFPAKIGHSTGHQAMIDGKLYQQQPTGPAQAFSDNFFAFPNDHGRVFGPVASPDGGYAWTAALSKEELGTDTGQLYHDYVSMADARDAVHDALVAHGATDLGVVAMGNAISTPIATTGDHDGNAVVIQLN